MKIIPHLINTIRLFSWLSIASFFLAISGFAADVTTYHNDNSHTGVNPDEIALTPAMLTLTPSG
jgi:hypothetical protein